MRVGKNTIDPQLSGPIVDYGIVDDYSVVFKVTSDVASELPPTQTS